MDWIITLALTLGGPFGLPMGEPPPFWQLESTGGWPGQAYDFNRFLPPAINTEHRLTAVEWWYAEVFFRDTCLGPQILRELPRRAESVMPPSLSILQRTGPKEFGSLLLGEEASPRVACWKMLYIDINEADHLLLDLTAADERVRLASVKQLGRLKFLGALDALTATLSDDPSSIVREGAARALTLIGAGAALPALQQAADYDPDHNVRRTALFAVEIMEAQGLPAAPVQSLTR